LPDGVPEAGAGFPGDIFCEKMLHDGVDSAQKMVRDAGHS